MNLKSQNVLKQQMKHSTYFWVCDKVRNPPKSYKTEQVQRILIRYHWVFWFPNLETQPKNTRKTRRSRGPDLLRTGRSEVWERIHAVSLFPMPAMTWTVLGNEHNWVVVSKIFYFHPYLGKIPNLTSIFFKGVETTN